MPFAARGGSGERATAVVVGNPKPASRTLDAATYLAPRAGRGQPDLVVDLATLGPALLDWQDPGVAGWSRRSGAADLVVVASPTYKATYSGLLKLFLDRFAGGTGLRGVAVPLMLGAGPHHALAAGAAPPPAAGRARWSVPAPGLFVLDAEHDNPAAYATGWRAPGTSSTPSSAGQEPSHDRRPPLHQPGPRSERLREAFGVFPSGVVAVAARSTACGSAWPRARSPR